MLDPYHSEIVLLKPWRLKVCYLIRNRHKWLGLSASFECYGSTDIINILFLLVRGRLYTSESDVYRRSP